MYEKMRGVVLHTLKYTDKNSIAHVYTDMRGRMSFLVPQGRTVGARMRNALFQPLSLLEFEARVDAGRDLHTMRDVRCLLPLSGICSDPVKSAIAIFVSELLTRSIQESERNTALWQYIVRSVRILEGMREGIANFHICFLYNLGPFLGIQPDTDIYHEGYWFDMVNGVFCAARPAGAYLPPDQAAALMTISRMTFSNLHRFAFNREQRNAVLDIALRYFYIHNSAVGSMRSPDILRQLFD